MSCKVRFGKLNGAVTLFGLHAQNNRPGWAYFSILGAPLRSSVIILKRKAVSLWQNSNRTTETFSSSMFTRRTNTLWHLVFCNVDTIMTGNFNCVPDVRVDKWGGHDNFGDKGIPQLHAFVSSISLEDVFRVKTPSEKLFTWFNGPHSVRCCLHRFYTPSAWRAQVRDHVCDPFSDSDHHIVSIKLQLRNLNP